MRRLRYTNGLRMENGEKKKGWRLLRRREILLPTWRGWLVLLLLFLLLGYICVRGAYGFLAVTAPVPGGALVVEGWAPDYALKQALTELDRGKYQKVFVTGVPVDYGGPLSRYKSYAEIGAATLVAFGLNSNIVQAVSGENVLQDRTYACAVALAQWFHANGGPPARLTLMTEGPHARRSRLLFQRALGKHVEVGIIAVPPNGYSPGRWWRSSAGVRTVLSEAIAYVYARLVFRPRAEPRSQA